MGAVLYVLFFEFCANLFLLQFHRNSLKKQLKNLFGKTNTNWRGKNWVKKKFCQLKCLDKKCQAQILVYSSENYKQCWRGLETFSIELSGLCRTVTAF